MMSDNYYNFFCLTGQFFWRYCRIGQVHKSGATLLTSCRPSNNIKALKANYDWQMMTNDNNELAGQNSMHSPVLNASGRWPWPLTFDPENQPVHLCPNMHYWQVWWKSINVHHRYHGNGIPDGQTHGRMHDRTQCLQHHCNVEAWRLQWNTWSLTTALRNSK